MDDIIQVENLIKSYGQHPVLKGLCFHVRKGEVFALLGVNGAGKTTAVECIEGLRRYDGGAIRVTGKMGIQLQSASLPSHIRPLEAVRLFAGWNKAKPDPALLESLGIYELSKKIYAELSTGQKRRLHLALALVGNPDIVFLDEPTAGLDVEGRISLHDQIRRLKTQGKTIVLASHDMAEVESLCDRMAILQEGRTAFEGTAEELAARIRSRYTLHIYTSQGEESVECSNIGDTMLALLEEYKRKGVDILDIKIDHGNLEQHFIEITKGA